jgi:ketosteroid isomerase-like protein
MSVNDQITAAYDKWDSDDIDGLLAMFSDDAMFIVPGQTRVSGDHDKASFRRVLADVAAETALGRHKQELICSYEAGNGAMWLFDNYVTINGKEEKYHSVHEWGFRDGRPRVWMLYVHEYNVFAEAWS